MISFNYSFKANMANENTEKKKNIKNKSDISKKNVTMKKKEHKKKLNNDGFSKSVFNTIKNYVTVNDFSNFLKSAPDNFEKIDDTNLDKDMKESKTTNEMHLITSESYSADVKFQKDKMQLSPGVSKRKKKFCINGKISPEFSPKKTPPKKRLKFNYPEEKVDCRSESPKKIYSFIISKRESVLLTNNKSDSYLLEKEKKFEDNGELLCFLLKKIITDTMKMQMDITENQRIIEKLFTHEEFEIVEKFCKLDKITSKLLIRLLCRSKKWYRLSTLVFKDIDGDLCKICNDLQEKNLIDINIEKENISTQLELLSKSEVQELCKLFKVSLRSNFTKKEHCINALIHCSKNQKTVIDMFKQQRTSSLFNLLQSEVLKYLGMCVKISEIVKVTFNKIILLFSFAHYYEEEEKRLRTQLYLCMNVYKNITTFPKYKLSRSIVFESYADFKAFSEALIIKDSLENSINSKQYEEFHLITEKVQIEFKQLLIDEKYCERYSHLQPFLKKFSAGHIYAKLLTKFCQKFKRKSSSKDIINVAQLLLAQNLFLSNKRGVWYEILAQTLESLKDYRTATEVIVKGLNDTALDEVQILTLQLRGQILLKKLNNNFQESHLKEILDNICTPSVVSPLSIVIEGNAYGENLAGYKAVYINETNSGRIYSSVEERALAHYKKNGFTKGYHVEGFIIQQLYAFMFFDIIYNLSPPGVFQSPYQEAPLDLYSKSFYLNRKNAIDERLNEILSWTEEEAEAKIKSVYYENFNISCIITWNESFSADLFCEIMKCITLPTLAKLFRKLIENFRVARAGFPDLTLWNPETKKCKFVEVKSPNDKLSSAQRVWLDFLRKVKVDCEVCNVKNVGRKISMKD